MLKVTDRAKQRLKELLASVGGQGREFSLRLVIDPPGRLGLVPGREGYGDQVVEHEGTTVLLIADEVLPALDGMTLDLEDTPEGPKLAVRRE